MLVAIVRGEWELLRPYSSDVFLGKHTHPVSDIAVVMGSTLVFGIVLVLTTLILDILYGFLDPRIRYE